jgi:hypothetical protein
MKSRIHTTGNILLCSTLIERFSAEEPKRW